MHSIILAIVLFIPTSILALDLQKVRNDLECVGKDARNRWAVQVSNWTEGTDYLPNLRGGFKTQLRYEISQARFCKELEHEKLANGLFQSGHFIGNSEYEYHDGMKYKERETSLNEIQILLSTGAINGLYNELNTNFLRTHCYDAKKLVHCQGIINRLLGLYIALDLIDRHFINISAPTYSIKNIQTALAGRFSEAQLSQGERAKLRLLKLAVDYSQEQLDLMKMHLNQIVHDLEKENRNLDIANVNLWRTNIALISNIKNSNGEYDLVAETAASDLFNQTSKMIGISLKKSDSQLRMKPQELYSNLSELRVYFISSGQISNAESITKAMGDLRTTSSELSPSGLRQFVEKWFWGFLTSYGTSFTNVFWGGFCLFILFFLIIICFTKKSSGLEKISNAIYDSANILLLHEAKTPLPKTLHILMKIISFIFVSSAAGYLLMYLSNAQL